LARASLADKNAYFLTVLARASLADKNCDQSISRAIQ
jgi:hypothetical protein